MSITGEPAHPAARPAIYELRDLRAKLEHELALHSGQATERQVIEHLLAQVIGEQDKCAQLFTTRDPRAYVRLSAAIRDDIKAGKLASGDRIPSIKILCGETGFSRQTAGKALQLLESLRLIHRVLGHGYYVL